MKFFNKTILVPTLKTLFDVLNNKEIALSYPCIYGDRIAIKHYCTGNMNVVRIWNTKLLFNIWYDDFSSGKFMGAVDYTVDNDKDYVKIDFMDINDDNSFCNDKMNEEDAKELNTKLIEFVVNKAKENNKKKVVIDVHHNLRIFDRYYKPEGFEITERRCKGNPFWLEAEYNIDK